MFTYKEFDKNITVNGHDITVKVKIETDYDDCSIRDLYDDSVESYESIEKRFQAKGIYLGVIVVTATAESIEGIDSLGGCELSEYDDSLSPEYYLKDHTMVENALIELSNSITREFSSLTDRAKQYKKYSKADS